MFLVSQSYKWNVGDNDVLLKVKLEIIFVELQKGVSDFWLLIVKVAAKAVK